MAWTDERLDDAFTRIDRNFDRVWDEFRDLRNEMRAELRDFRRAQETSARQLATIGWAITGVLIAQLTAVILAFA